MKYLISVIDTGTGTGTPAEMATVDAFNEGLQADGHWVSAAGLSAPSAATVIDNRDDAGLFTDGPFVETKEWVSGFWIIDATDDTQARALAAEGSKACNRKVEVRAFLVR
jgi:hypothetical protein